MFRKYWSLLYMAAALLALLLISRHNYLVFHSLIELFTVVVGTSIFIVAWNTRDLLRENRFILFVGIGFLAVSVIDVLHMLSYRGMGVFPDETANLPTQFWIAARWVQALSLLLACAFLIPQPPQSPPPNPSPQPWWTAGQRWAHWVLAGHAVVVAALLLLIMHFHLFPHCFTEGSGQTPFKKISEYLISLMLLASAALLVLKRHALHRQVRGPLALSLVFMAAAELTFTAYVVSESWINAVGHLLRVLAYIGFYRAMVQIGLSRPFELLFHDLTLSQQALLAANQNLELQVQQRTALAERRAEQIRQLALRLGQAERRERRRLASILHDHIQQLLAAARMYLGTLKRNLPPDQHPQVRRVDDLLTESIAASRSLTMQLAPPVLHESFDAALRWLADWMRDKHSLHVTVTAAPGSVKLSDDARNVAFEAVRELLFNVVKHANVTQAAVDVAHADGHLLLTVSDRGAGFQTPDSTALDQPTTGFGLRDLRHRLELLGGTLDLDSHPGAGTRATVRLRTLARTTDEQIALAAATD